MLPQPTVVMIHLMRRRRQATEPTGADVIWDWTPSAAPVIPAKAGIQSVGCAFHEAWGVDSRFRGNDCGLERARLANDTNTDRRNRPIGDAVSHRQ